MVAKKRILTKLVTKPAAAHTCFAYCAINAGFKTLMYTELRKQILDFIEHSRDADGEQFLGLLCCRAGSHAADAIANILGSSFQGKQRKFGVHPGAATLTEVRWSGRSQSCVS